MRMIIILNPLESDSQLQELLQVILNCNKSVIMILILRPIASDSHYHLIENDSHSQQLLRTICNKPTFFRYSLKPTPCKN